MISLSHWSNAVSRYVRALAVISFLLASVLLSRAQKIYEVGVYSMGRSYTGDWTFRLGDMRFGFEQYRQNQDSNGRDSTSVMAPTSRRYTEVYLGVWHFRVRGPAWLAASIAGVAFASASLVLVVGVARIRQPDRRNALNLKGFQPDAADNR